jgi:flotillin
MSDLVDGLAPSLPLIIVATIVALIVISVLLRVVVPTNRVHIVQSRRKTTSYGSGQKAGNVYYNWPSWAPLIGITRIVLPVNNFELSLSGYEAYDKDRVPFRLDLTAFFRIADTNVAAARIATMGDLTEQLHFIVQGAARKILAAHDIHQIMVDRATFGAQFTEEVANELSNWGVEPVKNRELMDVRDAEGSRVIADIMAMKASNIQMTSRIEVANNMKAAQTAEIAARQEVDVREQEAQQVVGQRTAEKDKQVGIATEKAAQEVQAEAAVTREREMQVLRVATMRQAEITKDQQVVAASQDKETTILRADGDLQATKLSAEGIRAEGTAKADAEKALQLAPVAAQIELAKEIGQNEGYQAYLVSLKGVEAYVAVGVEQAKAIAEADIKVIANTGEAVQGVSDAMALISPRGGTSIAGMLEALRNTPEGAALLDRILRRDVANGAAGAKSDSENK